MQQEQELNVSCVAHYLRLNRNINTSCGGISACNAVDVSPRSVAAHRSRIRYGCAVIARRDSASLTLSFDQSIVAVCARELRFRIATAHSSFASGLNQYSTLSADFVLKP